MLTQSTVDFNRELDKQIAKIYSDAIANNNREVINNIVKSGILPKQRAEKEVVSEVQGAFSDILNKMKAQDEMPQQILQQQGQQPQLPQQQQGYDNLSSVAGDANNVMGGGSGY